MSDNAVRRTNRHMFENAFSCDEDKRGKLKNRGALKAPKMGTASRVIQDERWQAHSLATIYVIIYLLLLPSLTDYYYRFIRIPLQRVVLIMSRNGHILIGNILRNITAMNCSRECCIISYYYHAMYRILYKQRNKYE